MNTKSYNIHNSVSQNPIPMGRSKMSLLKLFPLLILMISLITTLATAQTLTISKSNNATNPIASGLAFTYTITYSWSGGAPGTLYITDNVPANLDVISALPTSPISTITGNQVTFAISGLTLPSGAGTVQINAMFKPGVTCAGAQACNQASISLNPSQGNAVVSNRDCVTAGTPTNKWIFEKRLIAGCAIDDEVYFMISITSPPGSDIGGLNLTNLSLSDFLPPGAVITGVIAGGWGGWSGWTGTTLTGGPSQLTVSPWSPFYVTYVKVKFPSPTFVAGQTAINKADFTFNTPCDQKMITWSDTAKVVLCNGVNSGSIGKWLSLSMYFPNNPSWSPVFTPGCCGTYTMAYNNTGTLTQSNFVMVDDVPPEVDVNTIRTYVPAGNAPLTLEVYNWSAGTCQAVPCTTVVYNTPGYYNLTVPPSCTNVCKVKWSYSGTIGVAAGVYNYLDVCVRTTNYTNGAPVLAGNNIINSVTASATGLAPLTATNIKVVDPTKPKVIPTKLFIGGCTSPGCQVTPGGPFQPGDIVRYRIAVTNIGNANATTCAINDILPAGLTYAGNETYFYGSFNWMIYIYNPPCCSLTVAIPSQIGGSITSPSVGATNLNWTFPVLPGRCDGTVDYFLIDFDVKISDTPPAPPGQYLNTFDFTASNVPTVTSNVAVLTVNAVSQLQAIKEVRKHGTQDPWTPSVLIPANGIADFKLTVKNTGNTYLSNVCVLDIMPHLGDVKVLPAYTGRGSVMDIPYNPADGPVTITPTGFTTYYNTVGLNPSKNPTRSTECGGFCGVADPAGAVTGIFGATPAQTFSLRINANSGVNLAPGASLGIIIPTKVPTPLAPVENTACNSFAIHAYPLGIPSVCLAAESNNACVQVEPPKPCFVLTEQRLNCVGQNSSGNWVYQLQFNITNQSGQNGVLSIIPSSGTIISINPTTLPNNVPTNVNAAYLSAGANGSVCFNVILSGPNHNVLCDTTFCLDLKPCPNPCPCPIQIKFEKPQASQASGNQIWINNLLTVGSVMKIKASIISATVNQTCLFGGTTTYTPAAVISSVAWNPITTVGIGTSEVVWTNSLCPSFNGQQFGMYLDVPSAPSKKCYQIVNICIRYTITDCKCQTCDTVICYRITRKWMPIIYNDNIGIGTTKGGLGLLAEEPNFVQIAMSSDTKGVLTIINPAEDEYTTGITLQSLTLSTSPGVRAIGMKPTLKPWTDGVVGDNGITSTGVLAPGEKMVFNLLYENADLFKTWVNNLKFKFTIAGIPDTLSGMNKITVRTPGAVGGDILLGDNTGDKIPDARTYALFFKNANSTKDTIGKLVLKLKAGQILAVGPYLDNQEVSLSGFSVNGGQFALLPGTPESNTAIMTGIPAGANIGPIYITVTSDNPELITLDYQTLTNSNDIVTEGTVELKSIIGAVNPDGGNNWINIKLSDAQPNPTDGTTTFKFELADNESSVNLVVTNSLGITVATVLNSQPFNSGTHEVTFNPNDLPNGAYYFTITTNSEKQTRKFIILR
ncbi:MAG: T9SS type A sorting domain-containing protein [bacterium]